jgi:UTP--glucose-1-phosphate uridylyltransferase
MDVRKAVIPAAGFGTRFLPLTKVQTKKMLPVSNKTTAQHVVEAAIDSGAMNEAMRPLIWEQTDE